MAEKLDILVIDDDEEFQQLVEFNLELSGFGISKATNGKDGLEMAKKVQPDVILLDRTMPDMDGLHVLQGLKNNVETENIPVFMLTGKTQVGEIEDAFELGADDYITKPVELMKLGQIIQTKLEKRKK